jgi:hypothetical protein
MSISLDELLTNFSQTTPASEGSLRFLERTIGEPLPADYRAFLLRSNGGEGFIGKHYLILWKVEELAKFNDGYQVGKYAPGFVMFGSTGGGDGFAFDTRSSPYRVMQVPFVGMSLDDCTGSA